MICHRCHRTITYPTWIAGHPYGSDCARNITGHHTKPSTRKHTHAHAEQNPDQPDLFSNAETTLDSLDRARG